MDHLADWKFANKGYPCWISDADEAFLEATIDSISGNTVTVTTKSGKKVTVDTQAPLKPAPRGRKAQDEPLRLLPRGVERSTQGAANMDDLHPLNEASILTNIEQRFRMDLIYTRTGPILIAMNPFKFLPIYQDEIIRMYHGRPYGVLPPHCYQEAEDCFVNMRNEGINQSVIICGESGAGKTETTKKMLHYLSSVSKNISGGISSSADQSGPSLGERMVDSNNLTEAFGNAKTVRNNNSSRFGKFTIFTFKKTCAISGGRIKTFLLEKSRVATQPKNERNYHIFYQLLCGAPDDWRKKLELLPVKDFHYLNQSGCTVVPDMDDSEGLDATTDAMDKVNIKEKEQADIFRMVAGVLHLGNIDFKALPDGESCDIAEMKAVNTAATVLGLEPKALEKALITRVRVVPPDNQVVVSPQTADQARDSRDALGKALYSRLFDDLVHKTNLAFDLDPDVDSAFIGVLDIFGFEDLTPNGFEQVFINYTNEKLQNIFNDATFRKEVEEYTREQIPFDRRDFPDNQPCLDLIEKKPVGLLPLMDSECLRGAVASDQSLVSKYHQIHAKQIHYAVCGPASGLRHANGQLTADSEFVIKHYAGPIIYSSAGFVDKNKDAVFDHVYDVMSRSSIPCVAALFPAREGGSGKATGQTVATRFCQSLNDLVETLSATSKRFVRCVKTNGLLKPQIFDKPNVLRQLKTSGVMSALEIRRAGYPTRVEYRDFVKQFRVFSVGSHPKEMAVISALKRDEFNTTSRTLNLTAALTSDATASEVLEDKAAASRMMTHSAVVSAISQSQYRLGLTKIFFQADVLITLQTIKDKILLPYAKKIQDWWLKKQEKILEHKLTRASYILQNSIEKATIHGVAGNPKVYNALETAGSAVQYARGLASGLFDNDIFRPALDQALSRATEAQQAVNSAVSKKQLEIEQRAELLGDLDSGRARLGRVQEGCKVLTVKKDALEAKAKTAAAAIDGCREELLHQSNNSKAALQVQDDDNSTLQRGMLSRRGSASFRLPTKQRSFTGRFELPAADAMNGAEEEIDLEVRKENCAKALALVSAAEQEYTRLNSMQLALENARAAGRASLDKSKESIDASLALARAAGVHETTPLVAANQAAGAAIGAADNALMTHNETDFSLAVKAAEEAAVLLAQVAVREKQQREEEDRREQGRATLRGAANRHGVVFDEVISLGVQHRPPMAKVLQEYQALLDAAHLAEVGESGAFIEAADKVVAAVGETEAVLAQERARKEGFDRVRAAELARLEPPSAALTSVEMRAAEAGVIDEPAVRSAIGEARVAIVSAKQALEAAEDASTLSNMVLGALSLGVAAERAFTEAKQRKDTLEREASSASRELASLEQKLTQVRLTVTGSSETGPAVLDMCESALAEADSSIAEAKRTVKKGDNADAMRAAVGGASIKVKEAEALMTKGQSRAEQRVHHRLALQQRLRSSADVLQGCRSSLVAAAINTESSEEVKTAVELADEAMRHAHQLVGRTLTAALLKSDSAEVEEEAATGDAARRAEQVEGAVSRAIVLSERLAREWAAAESALGLAMDRYETLTSTISSLDISTDDRVAPALSNAEAAWISAKGAGDSGGNKGRGDPAVASASAAEIRGATDALVNRLGALETAVSSARTRKEAADASRAQAKIRLDSAASRLRGAVAAAGAAGPDSAQLCSSAIDEATEAVNIATHLLRRNGEVEVMVAAVNAAVNVVAQAEQHVQRAGAKVGQAQARRAAAVQKLSALSDSFTAVEERAHAEALSAETSSEVHKVLHDARSALEAVQRLVETGPAPWISDAPGADKAVQQAAQAILTAEEVVDDSVATRRRAAREAEEMRSAMEHLMERHVAAGHLASSIEHIQPSPRFAACSAAVEAEVEAVHAAMAAAFASAASDVGKNGNKSPGATQAALLPTILLKSLKEKVVEEEEVAAMERQRCLRLLSLVELTKKELPNLEGRLLAVQAVLDSSIPHAALMAGDDIIKARSAVSALRRFSELGASAAEEDAALTEGAAAAVAAAETSVGRHVGRLQRAMTAQASELKRVEAAQEHFTEVCTAVALFVARSDQLKSSLDAEWADVCYWRDNTQSQGLERMTSSQTHLGASSSSSTPAVSSVTLLSQAMAHAESALSAARRAAGSAVTVWLTPGHGGTAAKLTQEANHSIAQAQSLVERETRRLDAVEHQRAAAQAALRTCVDRVASAVVTCETNEIAFTDASSANNRIAEAIRNAEHAFDVVAELLRSGGANSSSPALEEASRRALEVEEAVAKEVHRNEVSLAAHSHAKYQIAECKRRLAEIAKDMSGLQMDNSSHKDVASLVELAEQSFGSNDRDLTSTHTTDAVKATDDLEHTVMTARTKQRDAARLTAAMESAARVKAKRNEVLKRAEEEEATKRRRRLEDDLSSLVTRLGMSQPIVEEVVKASELALEAVNKARDKKEDGLTEDDVEVVAKHVAAVEAVSRTLESSSLLNGTDTTHLNGNGLNGSGAAPHAIQDRTATAVESLTANVHFLTKSLLGMQQLMMHQSRVMELQGQLLSGAGDREKILKEIKALNSPMPGSPTSSHF